jgi:LysM repeat protein
MYEHSRPRRSPTRYLAPLALAAILIAVYLVVQNAEGPSSSGASGTRSSHTSTRSSGGSGSSTKKTHKSKFYVVKSGDSLSVISARTGVPLPTLESLNPGVSTSSLQVGQRLRLRR